MTGSETDTIDKLGVGNAYKWDLLLFVFRIHFSCSCTVVVPNCESVCSKKLFNGDYHVRTLVAQRSVLVCVFAASDGEMRRKSSPAVVKATDLLRKILRNILQHPNLQQYRRLKAERYY